MTKRTIAVFCAFIVLFCSIFLKTGAVAINPQIAAVADTQALYTLSFGKTRGKIYDSNMVSLVENTQTYVAACLPTKKNKTEILNCNAIFAENKAELLKAGKPFLAVSNIAKLNMDDVIILPSTQRYSENQAAQHIIGYISSDGVGVTGIEKAYDSLLNMKSQKSKISFALDATGDKISQEKESISLAPGLTQGVVLTIDLRIQRIVESVGKKSLKKGAIVIMEPSTGNLLAVASFPSYSSSSLQDAIKDSNNSPLINRAFMSYSTGSVFKIATTAAALESGIQSFSHTCVGYENIDGQIFKCHKLAGHGLLDLQGGIAYSCNPYFIALGQKVGATPIINMAKALSLGQKSRFAEGLYSAAGSVPSPDSMSAAELANISFGQGALSATPVQIARMVSAIVNNGYTPPANLVLGTTSNGKLIDSRETPSATVKAMSSKTAAAIKEMLVKTIMDYSGQNGKPKYVTAGGKTGTAQTGSFKADGSEINHGWFAGFFPAKSPKYVAVVFEEDSEGGNAAAAPIFKEIADELYAPLTLPDSLKS